MKSYILTGSNTSKDIFINNLLLENNIPQYNVIKFEEPFKIQDARLIKKNLSLKAFSGKNRAFIIYQSPTLEAQNALLKTVEELPDDTLFVFVEAKELLPTIMSRSFLVNLSKDIQDDKTWDEDIAKMLEKENIDFAELFTLTDYMFDKKNELVMDRIVLALRRILLSSISEKNFKLSKKITTILKRIDYYLPLIELNNLNKKLVFEKVLLSCYLPY